MNRLSPLFRALREYFLAHALFCGSALLALVVAGLLFIPAPDFPLHRTVDIRDGASLAEIAAELGDAHAVLFPEAFMVLVRMAGSEGAIRAGVYRFERPLGMLPLALALHDGKFGIAGARVTIPEGFTSREIGAALARLLPRITERNFALAAAGQEGYLFPDTYAFMPDATAADVVRTMRANFDTRIASITPLIQSSGHSLSAIVVMASLVEKEAKTPYDRRMVAGILWNRIRLGMPLQVDAVFGYIRGIDTYAPSAADLSLDSPYNTYLHAGLPPGPIANPGLDALTAAVAPAKTADLYYLTGKDGLMYYAKTYPEHVANRMRYL